MKNYGCCTKGSDPFQQFAKRQPCGGNGVDFKMKISTKGRYALRIMIDIAANGGEGTLVPLKAISERQEISIKYMEQIMSLLTRGGLVRSVRGNVGGYALARGPRQIRVGDILRAAEGDLAPVPCVEGDTNFCPRAGKCAALEFWQELDDRINEFVDSRTLEDMVRTERRLARAGSDSDWLL